ncbi:MAG: RluA family pseudouridine synthase [Paenibacillaceae bacterium]
MNYLEPLVYIVSMEDEGILVKSILRNRMKLSRSLIGKLKQTERGITLNGERVYTSVAVRTGDQVEIRMARESSDDILPQELPIEIIYEDNHLLVVNKSAGMIVHPTHGHYTNTLANAVVHHWLVRGEQVRFRPIHRLDQDTSGVLAIAKNPFVHQHVSEQMNRNEFEKEYIAFVHNHPIPTEATISAPIDRDLINPHIRVVTPDSGYPSVTVYRTEKVYVDGHASLVRIWLETGRTHQIRVHMKHIGCPLVGDKMYGLEPMTELKQQHDSYIARQALHAEMLTFTHPMTGERMMFKANWPKDLLDLSEKLESER